MKAYIELTDTFGGESNYSWVKRAEFDADGLSDRAIVRRAKALMGLTGSKVAKRETYGDMLALWGFDGSCTVMFITFGN